MHRRRSLATVFLYFGNAKEPAWQSRFGSTPSDPAALLRSVRSGAKLGRSDASANVSRQMKAKLRAQRPD